MKSLKVAFLIYIILTVVMLLNHEIWRDEGQAWLVARDSASLRDLFTQLRYEGHPGLWYLLIYPLAKLGLPVVSMSILHSLIAIAGVFLLFKYSKFPNWLKIGLAFSYFFFYEYNVIARNYSIFTLLVFIIAIIFSERLKRFIWVYILAIFLLANSSLFGLVATGAFLLFELVLIITRKEKVTKKFLLFFILITLGCVLSILQIWPAEDSGLYRNFDTNLTLAHLSYIHWLVTRTFTLFENGIYGEVGKLNSLVLSLIVGTVIMFGCLYTLRKNRRATLLLTIFSLLSFAIFFFKFPGTIRHWGLLFIFYVFCLWLTFKQQAQVKHKFTKLEAVFFTAILLMHLVPSVLFFKSQLLTYNSGGKATAEFINENDLQQKGDFIAVYPGYIAASIIPYLETKNSKLYILEVEQPRSYITWNVNYVQNMGLLLPEILTRFEKAASSTQQKFLILNYLPEDESFRTNFQLVTKFDQAVKGDEDMYVFEQL